MSILSNITDEETPKQPRCPQCCSDALAHYRHPTTDEPVCAEGMYLARCTSCEHVFGISREAERYIPADDKIGGSIEEELHCPACNYNLRSLHFGAICPECGTRIPPSKRAIEAEHRGFVDRIPRWAPIVCFAVAFAFAMLTRFWPQRFGGEWLYAFVGLGLLIYGLKGIRNRRISLETHFALCTVRGGFALFWGTFYVIAGAVFIILAILLFFLL